MIRLFGPVFNAPFPITATVAPGSLVSVRTATERAPNRAPIETGTSTFPNTLPSTLKLFSVASLERTRTRTVIVYVFLSPLPAVTTTLTVLSPPIRPVLFRTFTEASGSEVCASTATDVVRAGTVIVPFSATVEPFTLMLFKPVSAEGSATNSVTLYSVTVVPFAAVTFTVKVFAPGASALPPVTWI